MLVLETSNQLRLSTIPSPRDLGLPHDAWRRHQYETYCWLADQSRAPVSIIEQPTALLLPTTVAPSSSPRPNRFSNNTPPSTAHSP